MLLKLKGEDEQRKDCKDMREITSITFRNLIEITTALVDADTRIMFVEFTGKLTGCEKAGNPALPDSVRLPVYREAYRLDSDMQDGEEYTVAEALGIIAGIDAYVKANDLPWRHSVLFAGYNGMIQVRGPANITLNDALPGSVTPNTIDRRGIGYKSNRTAFYC